MKFPYIQYDIAHTLRPIIPIRVELDGQSLRYDVLVDSGADMNIFDWDVARTLGIHVESGDPANLYGVTGISQEFYIHDVVLRVGRYRIPTKAGFAKLPNHGYGVVGQRGFFDQFKVTFDLPDEELEITSHRRAAR